MKVRSLGAVLCVALGVMVACSDDATQEDAVAGGTGGSAGTSSASGNGGKSSQGGAGRGGCGPGKAGTSGGGCTSSGGAGTSGDGGTSGHGGGGTGGCGPSNAGTSGRGCTSSGGEGSGGDDTAGEAGALGMSGGGGDAAGGAGGEGGVVGAAGAGEGGSDNGPQAPLAHCNACTRTKIGSPLWEPTGMLAVSGNIGSTTPDLFNAFTGGLVSPNHAYDANDNVIGPAIAHAGPYDDELFSLVSAKGLTAKQAFSEAEFTPPSGVVIMLNIVPSAGAATGSSFDFASGPIMPNALFPMIVDGDVLREGVMYDPNFDSAFPGYPAMTPPIVKDGPSHLLWFFGENSFFGPLNTPATGSYELKVTMTDSSGAGWLVQIPFTVAN